MKVRNGFVSNSSSCSFVLDTRTLKKETINAILNYSEVGPEMQNAYISYIDTANKYSHNEICISDSWNDLREDHDWEIEQHIGKLEGRCYLDNFDMEFFFEVLGIGADLYKYTRD